MTQSNNPYGGIFQYLVSINGTDQQVRAAQAKLAQLTPETAAVYQALNILPEGGLKSWLMANPVQFWTKVVQLFTGRKYTSGQYVLGERFIDQLAGGNVSRSQVSDGDVAQAMTIFTILFGVRIGTSEDLDALDYGVDTYYNRGEKSDIPRDAVERAVFLKQHFYPISTYNVQPWDTRYFEVYPLVAPIPGLTQGTLYNGPLPGGATAVNGIIPISANSILQQYPGSDFDPTTGTTTTPTGQVITPGSTTATGTFLDKIFSYVKSNPVPSAIIAAVVGYAVYETVEEFDQ